MPSIDDLFNELQQMNTALAQVNTELVHVNDTLNTGIHTLDHDLQLLVNLQEYTTTCSVRAYARMAAAEKPE
jgi:hypothetical protein